MKKYKAIVVDDHPLMAQATKRLLEQIEEIEVIGVAHDGRKSLELVEEHEPDWVFLDFQLPDQSGMQVTEQIKSMYPHVRVVIFTGVDVSDLVYKLLELRVSGIISKDTSESAFRHMVACIQENHIVLPQDVFYKIKLFPAGSSDVALLTEEEIRMMTLMVQGSTYEQIADTIHVSKRSVDNYLKRIYDKLGVQNRNQAIEKFVQSRHHSE
ncbi:response regulator [Cohnella soli]|uniref:Response regulator n=1 Tax=Cohnella soli TaxID=425005 RepID=A0ABW0HKC5_9BACL